MNKSTFLALVLLLCGSFFLSAQTSNYPFPTENAYWHTQLGCIEPYYEDIYTCQDTTMDGVNYSQLYSLFYFTNISGPASFGGGLRQEGDKIFFKTKPGSEESLVYDFSVQVGDTIRLTRHFVIWGGWTDTLEQVLFTVKKIDSVLLNDGWRKRWKADCFNNFYNYEIWIDGMGSTYGLVDRYICGFSGNVARVYCFWQNGETKYSTLPGVTCDDMFPVECEATVGTSHPKQKSISASIFPNPFSDYLTISFSGEMPHSISARLVDVLGRNVVIQQQKTGASLQIERSNLPPGIYFLKIENKLQPGQTAVFKVLAN